MANIFPKIPDFGSTEKNRYFNDMHKMLQDFMTTNDTSAQRQKLTLTYQNTIASNLTTQIIFNNLSDKDITITRATVSSQTSATGGSPIVSITNGSDAFDITLDSATKKTGVGSGQVKILANAELYINVTDCDSTSFWQFVLDYK